MFDFAQPHQMFPAKRSVFRALRNTPSTLPEADHQKLQTHLENCDGAILPGSTLLAYVLANKLMNTRPVADLHRSDLVVGGSLVTYAVDGDGPQTGLLVHSARTGTAGGVIRVASLLGATLIGMQLGQRAPLLQEDGSISTLRVIDVTSAI